MESSTFGAKLDHIVAMRTRNEHRLHNDNQIICRFKKLNEPKNTTIISNIDGEMGSHLVKSRTCSHEQRR